MSSSLDSYEKNLCDSYDNLLTWIFDETMFHQNNPKIVQQITKNYNKLPLNL